MATDHSKPVNLKAGKTGFAAACTINVLVVCSVLVAIPFSLHDREFNPFFLLAFFNQMEVMGVLALCLSLADIVRSSRVEGRSGRIYGIAGVVLAMLPLPTGLLALRIVAHILGWQLQY
jgi:Na+/pantothenate symporter